MCMLNDSLVLSVRKQENSKEFKGALLFLPLPPGGSPSIAIPVGSFWALSVQEALCHKKRLSSMGLT